MIDILDKFFMFTGYFLATVIVVIFWFWIIWIIKNVLTHFIEGFKRGSNNNDNDID